MDLQQIISIGKGIISIKRSFSDKISDKQIVVKKNNYRKQISTKKALCHRIFNKKSMLVKKISIGNKVH